MGKKIVLSKSDVIVTLVCVFVLIMTLGAMGGGSRRHAKDIVCRSNLQKWYLAMCGFTNDNDGSFWRGWSGMAMSSEWWMDALRDYQSDNYTMRCCPTATAVEWNLDGTVGPGYLKQPFCAWGIDDGSFLNRGDYGSYGINGWLQDQDSYYWDDPSKHWRNVENITFPNTVPFMLDAQWIDAWPEPTHTPPPYEDTRWGTSLSHFDRILQNRHVEAENCAFTDGTVRRVGLKELWTLKWHREFDTEGVWTLAGGATASDWPEWMRDMEAY